MDPGKRICVSMDIAILESDLLTRQRRTIVPVKGPDPCRLR